MVRSSADRGASCACARRSGLPRAVQEQRAAGDDALAGPEPFDDLDVTAGADARRDPPQRDAVPARRQP